MIILTYNLSAVLHRCVGTDIGSHVPIHLPWSPRAIRWAVPAALLAPTYARANSMAADLERFGVRSDGRAWPWCPRKVPHGARLVPVARWSNFGCWSMAVARLA